MTVNVGLLSLPVWGWTCWQSLNFIALTFFVSAKWKLECSAVNSLLYRLTQHCRKSGTSLKKISQLCGGWYLQKKWIHCCWSSIDKWDRSNDVCRNRKVDLLKQWWSGQSLMIKVIPPPWVTVEQWEQGPCPVKPGPCTLPHHRASEAKSLWWTSRLHRGLQLSQPSECCGGKNRADREHCWHSA